MTNFTYKCVPVPSIIETGKVGKDLHAHAVSSYENIINNAATGGWELVNIDTVTSVQKPGCLQALTGAKGETFTFKLLVFKKSV